MDSIVSLALMAKASAVFAGDDQFLSFPITPIVWQAARLGFQSGGLSPTDTVGAMSEFSRLVNIVPTGVMYPPQEESLLWDVYHDIFSSATLARSIRTSQEENDYQAASAILYTVRPDSMRMPTAKYQAYQQWEDAWITTKQVLNQRAVEAQSSVDPAVKDRWQRDQPALEAHLNEIMGRWQAEGFKDDIERALRIVHQLGAKSPEQLWTEWSNQFGETVNSLSGPTGDTFFASGFSPTDALREEAWQQFCLSRAEIAGLVAQAPAGLRLRLSPGEEVGLDSISFDYTSVKITRPWAPTDLFGARFWKLPPTARMLCDGAVAPNGRLPGYVSAIVLARNIKSVAAVSQPTKPPVTPPVRVHPPGWGPIIGKPPFVAFHPVLLETNTPLAHQPAATIAMPAHAIVSSTPVHDAAIPMSLHREQAINSAVLRLQSAGVKRIVLPIGTIPPLPKPAVPPTSPDIYVLALICRRLPRCPDPDPSLAW
jgi:hypothetical protein